MEEEISTMGAMICGRERLRGWQDHVIIGEVLGEAPPDRDSPQSQSSVVAITPPRITLICRP